MGGIDLCYGCWDPIQHPIAEIHPENLDKIVFQRQDYNNGRLRDFANLSNHFDRQMNSRMGWEDIGLSVTGPVGSDLCAHFNIAETFFTTKNTARWWILSTLAVSTLGLSSETPLRGI